MQSQYKNGQIVFPTVCPAERCRERLVPNATGVECPRGHYNAQVLPVPTMREVFERKGFDFGKGVWIE